MIPIVQFIIYLFFVFPLAVVTIKFIINNVRSYAMVHKLEGFHKNPNMFIGHVRLLTIALQLKVKGIQAGKVMTSAGKVAPFKDVGYMAGWIGNAAIGCPVVIPTRIELIKEVLGNKNHVQKSTMYMITNIAFGRGLLNSYRGTWTRHRKLLNPTFHQHLLQKYAPIMSTQSIKLVNEIKETIKSNESINADSQGINNNIVTDFTHKLSPKIMAVLLETIMGVHEGDLDPNFLSLAEQFDSVMCSRITSLWKIITPLYALSNEGAEIINAIKFGKEEVRRIISKRIKTAQFDMDDETRKPTLIDCLIEEHRVNPIRMPTDDIIDEVLNFLLAGWDTTTWATTILLQLIGNHADVQEKVYQEILDNINVDNGTIGEVSMQEAKKLKFMECVIFESLRLYPLVNVHGRRLTQELTFTIDGKTITLPQWTEILIDSELVHRSSRYWTDPDRFHPERFLSKEDRESWECAGSGGGNAPKEFREQGNIEPYSFIPFAAGARNCIGRSYACLEIKVILCHILYNFKVTSVDPMDKVKFNYVGTVRRTDEPIKLIFDPRMREGTKLVNC